MLKKKKTLNVRQRPAKTTAPQRNRGVFSYYSSGRSEAVQKDKPEAIKSRAKSDFRKLLARTISLAVAGLLLYSLLLSTTEPIVAVDSGNRQARAELLQDESVYARAASALMEESVLNRNKLTFNANGLAASLENQFPELSRVSIELPVAGHDPIVHVRAFEPRLILVSDSGTFVLDYRGRAVLPASQVSALGQFNLPVVQDETGLALETGSIALPERQVAFITEINEQLRSKKVKVTNMSLPPGGGELLVRVRDAPYEVRFNLYGDARVGAGRYLATKDYLESRGELPGSYIDVRVDNRAYYR